MSANNSHKTTRKALWLVIFLFAFTTTFAQEIPNGDGDLLWERSLGGRFVNDAKFHPINGNIIAAVNHEIWEIDPKDGHTIRVFEGGYPADVNDAIKTINITSDGQKIITGGAMGQKGILIWDYNTGVVTKIISLDEIFDVYENVGIFPDNNRIIFNTYVNDYGSQSNVMQINVYDLQLNKVTKSINKLDTYCDKFQISKDGSSIAYGLSYGTPGDWKNTMELWDAETLTKIRDFGEAGDIVEFRDVQISDDNQYVGFLCSGPRIAYLFNSNDSQLLKIFENTSAFAFTPNTKVIIYSGTKPDDGQSNILTLPMLDTVYQYIWARSFFRFNSNNEFYTGSKFYSNNWFTVGVDEPKISQSTIYPNPASDYINVGDAHVRPVQEIRIYDVFGNCALNVGAIHELPLRINISTLPAGVYFLRIGNEKPQKFMVVR